MVRVPLLCRGVAILLLFASTVVGQTPEPPAEFALDPLDSSPPDFLRQFSSDSRHPLLTLMVDGELGSFEASSAPESSKLKPTPQAPSASKKPAADDDCELDGGLLDGCQLGNACPTVSNCLPFACFPPPQPCNCRKCQRQRKHGHSRCGGQGCGSGYGYGYGGGGGGNPYLNWPTCPAWCFYGAPLVPAQQGCCGRRCGHGHRHGHGCQNSGSAYGCGYGGWGGYGGGCNMMGGDGFCGCMPYVAPPPQQWCNCRKCQRQRHHGCGGQGYGSAYGGGYGGWGMGGGFCGCGMTYLPPPQQCNCRKCQRHHRQHGCAYGYGCGYGCPGWSVDYGAGCGRHRGHHRGHQCQQQPYPYWPGSTMMGCMGGESWGGQYGVAGEIGSDSVLSGIIE